MNRVASVPARGLPLGRETELLASAEAYDENGVDRSMIRSALRRTPTECLETLDELLELAETARRVPKPLR